jgi:hypothetical protein
VVDREVIATTMGADRRTQFVIPDPIQGRVTTAPVPTFCFSDKAVRYKKSYPSSYGTNTRIAFLFADREPCSQEAVALLRSLETGIGLRQYSLPGEYDPHQGGTMNKKSEDRDRRLAVSLSAQ